MKWAQGAQRHRCQPVRIALAALRGFNDLLSKGFLQDGRSAFGVKGAAGNIISLAQIPGGLGVEAATPENRYNRGHRAYS